MSTENVVDAGISALARHYGVTEAEITEDLVDMADARWRSRVPLENVAKSLIVALDKLTRHGFDDGAVSRLEEAEP